MSGSKIGLGFGLTTVLAACQPNASAPGDSGAAADTADLCGATKVASWVGKADAPAAREAITQASGAEYIRWITPNMPVTMDYRQDRLNAHIDASGKFTGFDCA